MNHAQQFVLNKIRQRAARCRLGYGGKAWVTSDPKIEVVEDRMLLLEIIDQEQRSADALREQLQYAADSFRSHGFAVDADECESAINESLSGGNAGKPESCGTDQVSGIAAATGAGQLPAGNPGSTGDSSERRSPVATPGAATPDEGNRPNFDEFARHRDFCPICRSGLDTGLQCDECGADLMPVVVAAMNFEKCAFHLMEMMKAYERRVRSECGPEDIQKRPWECFEYISAAEFLRKSWSEQ